MSFQLTTLDSGLRVITQSMPHVRSVSLGVWVGVGARDEAENEHGICHLLEHMAFKGTKTRSARQIAEEVEQVGGDMNAATGLEMTAYYVRVLEEHVVLGLEILADIIQNSSFEPGELALEKDVILQEIAGIDDVPEEIAYDLALEAAFSGQGVGRPVIGTPNSVKAIGADELRSHLASRYAASNMVIAAAGAVDHETITRHVGAQFEALNPVAEATGEPARFVGGVRSSRKGFEQCHLVVGFPGPSYRDEGFMESQVFSGLFGGGMSSRLFQQAREARGLCYAIYSSAWGLRDGGVFGVHAATGRGMVGELAEVIHSELNKCANGDLTDREISRAKAQLRAGLLMGLESSAVRAEQMARHVLSYGRPIELEELLRRIEGVTAKGLGEFASKLIATSQPAVAVVGAGSRSERLAQNMSQLFAT
ncbi:MAG: M16 family metallopeptidase [Hyphomicrobiaceae bacterium]